jgi:hypothetical protein
VITYEVRQKKEQMKRANMTTLHKLNIFDHI